MSLIFLTECYAVSSFYVDRKHKHSAAECARGNHLCFKHNHWIWSI